jgi:hypothetical protein
MNAGVEFGDSILHEECYAQLQEVMSEDEVVCLNSAPTLLESVEDDDEDRK